MQPKKKNGDLATELKDLDVDRVDGVDRPATGRAFVVSKRAKGFRLFPTGPVTKAEREAAEFESAQSEFETLLKNVERLWLQRYVKGEVVRGTKGKPLNYVVVDDVGGRVAFKKREDAEAFALDLLKREHPKLYDSNQHGRPSGAGGGAMDSVHPGERLSGAERQANFPGSVTPPIGERPDSLLDNDYDHVGNPKRKTLWSRHEESMRKRGRSNVKGRKIFLQ